MRRTSRHRRDHPRQQILVEPYQKYVLRQRPGTVSSVLMKYWGAIGDFFYFLTFANHVLEKHADRRRILAADIYLRYHGNPLLELCQANGLIDELWLHKRAGAGPFTLPPEFYHQAHFPNENHILYRPGIYYDTLTGPGVVEYPVEHMRACTRERRFLVTIQPESLFRKNFTFLPREYITLQPRTTGKLRRNVVPQRLMRALDDLGIPVVVLKFPNDEVDDVVGSSKIVQVHDVYDPVTALWIQRYAKFHVGVESSQLLGATIHGVHAFYYPYRSISKFIEDLNIASLCHEIPWQAPPDKILRKFKEVLDEPIPRT